MYNTLLIIFVLQEKQKNKENHTLLDANWLPNALIKSENSENESMPSPLSSCIQHTDQINGNNTIRNVS